MLLKVARHLPTYKIPIFNYYSAIEKSSYVSIWFKIIHNKTFKETIASLRFKRRLV